VFGILHKLDPATKLRMLMAERDINVSELADRSGVSKATISALRYNPQRRPNIETARLIANALGVRINSIWPDL
jgi:DNA-binding XRE family transcriptional regulator